MNFSRRRLLPLTLLFAGTIGAPLAIAQTPRLAKSTPKATVVEGRTMGTTYRIKYWGNGAAAPKQVQEAVDLLLAQFDRQMSTYRDDSELSRFNQSPANAWFDVSSDTANVVAAALEYHRQTDGVLDVTVSPLLQLWHFGPGSKSRQAMARPPSAPDLRAARKLVGAQHLSVQTDPPALRKDLDGLQVELSSIAPGYAVDLVLAKLNELGFANAMVEIGGEVRASGLREDGDPWRVGVESPANRGRALAAVVPLRDLALSTAGDYRITVMADGKRYCHIIDPRSGQALPYRGAAVTVIAETCLEADAFDTPLLVMGPVKGRKWCIEHSIAAMFQTVGERGNVEVRTTSRFDELAPGVVGNKSP